ncbi:hypothetical protein ISS42_01715 [Candidatus Shapirobacteria bacterium]|nr:hypothetical protein [Candidatus Shapirobacteria bacterium]
MKKLLVPVAGGLILVIVSIFLILPRIKKIRKQFGQNNKLIEERRDFMDKAQLIASLNEEELTYKAQLATLAMPKEKEISLILYALGDPVRNNGFYTDQLEFNLGEITSGETKEEDLNKIKVKKQAVDQVPVTMRVLGPGKNLASLVEEMEKVLPLIAINQLGVAYSPSGRSTVSFDFHLSVSSRQPSYDPEKLTLKDLVLSSQEEDLLAQLDNFKKASFSSALNLPEVPIGPTGRENPFSLTQ